MENTDCHYTREELWEAYLGRLSPERATTLQKHFESGCAACLRMSAAMLEEMLGEPPEDDGSELGTAEPDAYDQAIDRALERARQAAKHLRKETSKLPEAVELLDERGAQAFGREAPIRLRGLAGVEALLQKSWEIRYEDPHEMVFRAALASAWARQLDVGRYGTGFVRDVQCRALIELGNAHRVADELGTAQKTLDEAARVSLEGSGDELLVTRLCDVQASLHADRRFFAASCEALDTVHSIHLRRGDCHLAGRALISKGIYAGYAGNTLEAEGLIRRGLNLIDEIRDPGLVLVAVHNLVYLLMDRGEFRSARSLLFRHRPRFEGLGGRIQGLKLRWIEGKIAAGLGKLTQAETIFREVSKGFQEERLGYKAALASLEIAVVLQQMGRGEETREVILEATEIFLGLGVHREALAGMLVLRKACQQGVATPALLRSTIHFLTRAEDNPDLAAESFLAR